MRTWLSGGEPLDCCPRHPFSENIIRLETNLNPSGRHSTKEVTGIGPTGATRVAWWSTDCSMSIMAGSARPFNVYIYQGRPGDDLHAGPCHGRARHPGITGWPGVAPIGNAPVADLIKLESMPAGRPYRQAPLPICLRTCIVPKQCLMFDAAQITSIIFITSPQHHFGRYF